MRQNPGAPASGLDIAAAVVPGVSTETLDRLCHDHIVHVQGAIPADLGYHGYPKPILTSVNQVVCHGIPSPDKILKKGDIVNIDVAVIQDGCFGDTSRMFFVGGPATLARRLVETAYEAMLAGIRQVRPVATKDRSMSAQWEHMVAVTPGGYEVLTPWPGGTGAYAAV